MGRKGGARVRALNAGCLWVIRTQKNPAIADRETADTWAFAGRRVPAHATPSSAAMGEFKPATVWPELNSKWRKGACNPLILFIWSLDFSKTWCHVCLFNRLDC
jgi:hypothetical protein